MTFVVTRQVSVYSSHYPSKSDNNLWNQLKYRYWYPKIIRGTYQGGYSNVKEHLLSQIEIATESLHSIDFQLIDRQISVDIKIFNKNYDLARFIKKLKYIVGPLPSNKPFPITLDQITEVIYFADNTNHHEVTGDDYLEFLDENTFKVKTIYNYSGAEIGAGHFYDTLIIFGSGIAINMISSEFHRKYREYIEGKKKTFRPLVHLNLSDSVHRILIEQEDLVIDNLIVELAEYDPYFLDFVLIVKDGKYKYKFIIDKHNSIKEFKKERI